MSVKPLEQLGAEALTLIALHIGNPPAATVAGRAQSAVGVAKIIGAVGAGDSAAALTALEGLTTSADPGVQQFIGDFYSQANDYLQFKMQLAADVPLIGAAAQAIATNIAAGMLAIATPYLPKAA